MILVRTNNFSKADYEGLDEVEKAILKRKRKHLAERLLRDRERINAIDPDAQADYFGKQPGYSEYRRTTKNLQDNSRRVVLEKLAGLKEEAAKEAKSEAKLVRESIAKHAKQAKKLRKLKNRRLIRNNILIGAASLGLADLALNKYLSKNSKPEE